MPPKASLSLQQKVSVTLLAVMAALALLSYLVLNATVAPAFADLELAAAEKNVVRAHRAIQNELENLGATVGDWAPWDDAHKYALGENPGFIKSNLDIPTMINLGVDLLIIYDARGEALWSQLLLDGKLANHEKFAVLQIIESNPEELIYHTDLGGSKEGLLRTAVGPMLLSSHPIITSDKTGPIVGTIIMCRFLNATREAALRKRTEVSLTWHLIDSESPLDGSLMEDILAGGAGSFTYAVDDEEIRAYGLLTDLFGEPLLILQADTPRQISALGGRTVNGALLFLSAAGIVIAIVTWLLLRRIIVLPLERLANHITGIRTSGDLSLRLNEKRTDEIGALANEFDKMTLQLHDARRQLLDQSFKAGKADTAAEVLHNIRNAMTPLINGIDRLSKTFRIAGDLRVQQAIEELYDRECPQGRRDKLLQYVRSAFSHVEQASDRAGQDLQVASRQARQVEAILSDQERHANVAPVIETLELQSMIEEAALVIPDKDTSGIELSLHPELAGFSVLAHRVGLVQVLGNLILNAWESIKRSQSESGSIRVTARIDDSGERSLVRVTIADSGCGFTDEVHPKIFQRGFSSKRGHLSGLGLHWCANALASMGGRISAESAGADRGAEFHVVLPGSTKDAATARRRKQQGRDREVGKDREIIVAEMAGRMQREYAQR